MTQVDESSADSGPVVDTEAVAAIVRRAGGPRQPPLHEIARVAQRRGREISRAAAYSPAVSCKRADRARVVKHPRLAFRASNLSPSFDAIRCMPRDALNQSART